jgi:uncharacterized protein (TIGR02996 family)
MRAEAMPTDDRALSFLTAVKDAPEEDAPRLVFADWLEDRDDPRGTFLRLQVLLAQEKAGSPKRLELAQQAGALLEQHTAEWLGPLARAGFHCSFQRGLIHLRTSPSVLLTKQGEQIARDPAFAWVDELRMGKVSAAGGKKLAASAALDGLVALHLSYRGIRDAGAIALAGSPRIARLRVLELEYNGIERAGAEALAASPHLANLRILGLLGNWFSDAGAQAIAASPHLTQLQELSLANCNIHASGATAVASAPQFATLRRLYLTMNPYLGDKGAEALARSPHLNNLEALYVDAQYLSVSVLSLLHERFGPAVYLCGAQT